MRLLRVTAWTMMTAGLLILAFLGYQLFGTTLITARAQAQAESELDERFEGVRQDLALSAGSPATDSVAAEPSSPGTEQPAGAEGASDEEGSLAGGAAGDQPATRGPGEDPGAGYASVDAGGVITATPELVPEPAPNEGEPLGRITIPKIEAEHVIFEGVTRDTLKAGPGHMPWTPLPGQPGNAVVSGHRTTYGAPFYSLDALEAGDRIFVETALGTHTYQVRETLIVKPTDVWVTEARPGAWLTLTTCNPRFSAAERLVIVAELVDGPNAEYAAQLKAQQAEAG